MPVRISEVRPQALQKKPLIAAVYLSSPAAENDQRYAGRNHGAAVYRGWRDRLRLIRGRFEWTYVDDFFTVCVGNPLIGERQPAENDQYNADDQCRSHFRLPVRR